MSNINQLKNESDKYVKLINEQIEQLPENRRNSSNIFIGGVAQGSMLALSTFLRYEGPDPLGGVVGLIGYVPLPIVDII